MAFLNAAQQILLLLLLLLRPPPLRGADPAVLTQELKCEPIKVTRGTIIVLRTGVNTFFYI
jgi:hypothetical protein